MRLVAVPVHEHDVTGTHDGLHCDLVGSGGAVRSEEQMLTTEGPRGLFLSHSDVAGGLQQRIQTAGRGGGLRHENVCPVKVTKVSNPMGIEDRLTACHWKSVERAHRTARVVL